ncbi:MAG: alpha/beta hydrolase [Clostridiales bacterium]|jgi:acetyl esterase/lipase|nr:alpha/beta hydrolase [Clostridiales bacterium]
MKNKCPFDPDFLKLNRIMGPILDGDEAATKAAIRYFYSEWDRNVSDDEIKVTKLSIPSEDVQVDIQVLEPKKPLGKQAPCLIYYHGGGFILPMNTYQFVLLREYIRGASCKAVCVNYRLAPDVAFPGPFYDCYNTLIWVRQNAEGLGINPDKIILAGDSAGGLMSAAASLMARDNNLPLPAAQMHFYPGLDPRLNTGSMKLYTQIPGWNAIITEKVWGLFLKDGDKGMRSYCSPLEAGSLAGLPQAYVETAEFDCLHDDGINYAEALKKAGVPVELNETKGTVHAYDYIMENHITKENIARRIRYMNKVFGQ